MKKIVFVSLIALSTTFAACSVEKSDSSSTPGSAPVSLKAVASGGTAAAPAYSTLDKKFVLGSEGVTITSVRVVLGGVNLHGKNGSVSDDDGDKKGHNDDDGDDKGKSKFSASHEDEGDHHVKGVNDVDFAGPYVLDLTKNMITPSLEDVTIPTGTYKKIDLSFAALTAAQAEGMAIDASDAIVGHSYVIEGFLNHATIAGVVTDGTIKFRIFGDQDKSFKVNLKKGLTITGGTLNDVLLVFDAAGWMPSSLVGQLQSGLNKDSVTIENGVELVVVLDANRNMSIAAQFHKLFHESVKIGKDDDGDGETDGDSGEDLE